MTMNEREAREADPGGRLNDGCASPAARIAVDELYRVAYEELTRRAAAVRRADPFAVVSTRTLVHETWLKLSASAKFRFDSQAHLWNIVTGAMRQVLVDSARHRRAAKRDGLVVPVDDSLPIPCEPTDRILAVHDALTRLEQLDADQAWIVEARFFGGLGFTEIAELLGISESTVRRRWEAARALLKVWLHEVD
jgi:RNA polymerase sigma factor (TIGR02999 family)